MEKFFLPGIIVIAGILNMSYPRHYPLPQVKKRWSSIFQQPHFAKSPVELYQYLPSLGSNRKKNYLRFVMSGYMYNYWLIWLNKMTAKPTAAQKLQFYKIWTGIAPLDSTLGRYLWSPITESLTEIYRNFSRQYHPYVGLQTILQDFLTSEDGFLKFYLTFVGQYQGNNFFPMGADYNEYTLQNACRKQGCVFQIPVIPDSTFPESYDVGPTINILPDTSPNTYLKNFWRYVTIRDGAVVRNIWPIVAVQATPIPSQEVTVRQVLTEIITGVERIFNTVGMALPWITISDQFYDKVVPRYNPQDHERIRALELNFNYWVSRLDLHPYQNQLKIELVYQAVY